MGFGIITRCQYLRKQPAILPPSYLFKRGTSTTQANHINSVAGSGAGIDFGRASSIDQHCNISNFYEYQ
jgi:hypothetical protein